MSAASATEPLLFELHDRAREAGIAGYRRLSRAELLEVLRAAGAAGLAPAPEPEPAPAEPRSAEEAPPPAAQELPPPPPAVAEERPRTRVEAAVRGALGLLTLTGATGENVLSLETLEELADEAERLAADERVRVVGVVGTGKRIFCAGADLDSMRGLAGAEVARRGSAACERLAALPVPSVALLNGHAVGGGLDLALACDWRVAAAGVKLRFIHNELGYTAPWGLAGRLAALTGRGRALRLFALHQVVTAEEALGLGIVDEIVERERLLTRARSLATRVARADRRAVEATKALLHDEAPGAHERAFAALWDAKLDEEAEGR